MIRMREMTLTQILSVKQGHWTLLCILMMLSRIQPSWISCHLQSLLLEDEEYVDEAGAGAALRAEDEAVEGDLDLAR